MPYSPRLLMQMMAAFQNFVKWRDTDEAKEMIEDERNYVDNTSSVGFIVEEHQMK